MDSGIFKYQHRLPPAKVRVSLGEGSTPLIPLERLGREVDIPNLFAKMEGCNPTGSYKDRVAAMSLSWAASKGYKAWIATSSGNAGTSLAAYGSRAGLPGFLCVTHSIPREKLLPIECLGATVVRVKGIGDGGDSKTERALFDTVRRAAADLGLFLGVTAHEFNDPGMHGADTIAYEIVEYFPGESTTYVPTGGGGLVSAICRGFSESGESIHRVVCAQPSGCAPISEFLRGNIDSPRIHSCYSTISGLQLPSPPDGQLATTAVQRSGGWGSVAEDDEILRCQRLLAAKEGVFVEPAAATSLACAIQDRRDRRISRSDNVILILTSSGLKNLASLESKHMLAELQAVESLYELVSTWTRNL